MPDFQKACDSFWLFTDQDLYAVQGRRCRWRPKREFSCLVCSLSNCLKTACSESPLQINKSMQIRVGRRLLLKDHWQKDTRKTRIYVSSSVQLRFANSSSVLSTCCCFFCLSNFCLLAEQASKDSWKPRDVSPLNLEYITIRPGPPVTFRKVLLHISLIYL